MTAATSITTHIPLELFYRLRRAAAACQIALERKVPGAKFEYSVALRRATLTLPGKSPLRLFSLESLDYEGAIHYMNAIAEAEGATTGWNYRAAPAPAWMTAKEAV